MVAPDLSMVESLNADGWNELLQTNRDVVLAWLVQSCSSFLCQLYHHSIYVYRCVPCKCMSHVEDPECLLHSGQDPDG